MTSSFWLPTRIRFGIHAIEKFPEFASEFLGQRALLITSRSHANRGDAVGKIIKQLKAVGIATEVFAGVRAEPTSDLVDNVAEIRRVSGCDWIIALGGGSVIDVAKFVAMMATNGGRCADYETGRAIAKAPLPLIAIPTTAGSGSEVTPYAVITNSQTQRKFTVNNSHFHPRCAIIDPALTVSQPATITLASGFDAWIQALEAHLSLQENPLLGPLIENVLKMVPANLSTALSNPENLEARAELSRASVMSGIIISHLRTGLVHTMSVALSAHVDLPHGLLNAVILPRVLEFNFKSYRRERLDFLSHITFQTMSCPHAFGGHPLDSRLKHQGVANKKIRHRFAQMNADFRIRNSPDRHDLRINLRNLRYSASSKLFCNSLLKHAGVTTGCAEERTNEIKDWLQNLGAPRSLANFNLDEKIIPSLAARVRQDSGLSAVNPRPFSDDDLFGLFRKVLFDD